MAFVYHNDVRTAVKIVKSEYQNQTESAYD